MSNASSTFPKHPSGAGKVARQDLSQKSNSETPDNALESGRHNRNYDPAKSAKSTSISSTLNADSSRYRKGPSVD